MYINRPNINSDYLWVKTSLHIHFVLPTFNNILLRIRKKIMPLGKKRERK